MEGFSGELRKWGWDHGDAHCEGEEARRGAGRLPWLPDYPCRMSPGRPSGTARLLGSCSQSEHGLGRLRLGGLASAGRLGHLHCKASTRRASTHAFLAAQWAEWVQQRLSAISMTFYQGMS